VRVLQLPVPAEVVDDLHPPHGPRRGRPPRRRVRRRPAALGARLHPARRQPPPSRLHASCPLRLAPVSRTKQQELRRVGDLGGYSTGPPAGCTGLRRRPLWDFGRRGEGDEPTTNGVGMERQPSSSSTSERPSTFYTSRRALRGFRKRPPTQTASGQNLFPPGPHPAVVVRFTFCFYRGGREQSTTGAARRRGGSWKQRKEKGHCSQAPDGRTDGRACRRRHQSCTAAHSLHLPCHARCSAAVAVGSAGARPRRDVDLCCWADRRRRQRAGEERRWTGRGDPAWMSRLALPVLPTFPRALRSAGSVWPAVPSASLPPSLVTTTRTALFWSAPRCFACAAAVQDEGRD
jgi:hypothetical protein